MRWFQRLDGMVDTGRVRKFEVKLYDGQKTM